MNSNDKVKKPLIIDIKGNSLDDGPGIRSVVFFKGCPLDCVWCQNPESKSIKPELLFDNSKCIKCKECLKVCKPGAITFDNIPKLVNFLNISGKIETDIPSQNRKQKYLGYSIKINREKCIYCFNCVDNCPSKALTRAGYPIGINDIINKIIPYEPFFKNSGGGVTLSGGEPTLYIDYLSILLKKLKEHDIHTLIETSGCFKISDFESKLLPYVDTIFMDIKFIDKELHKKHCGIDNKIILSNFIYLYERSKEKNFEILSRTPLIPELTDTDKNISDIIRFYKENNVIKAALMKNNPIWFDKNEKLGIKKESFTEDSVARSFYDLDIFKKIKAQFESNGIVILEY